MNIAVLTWYDDAIKNWADKFYEINELYCSKHGYTLIKSSERAAPPPRSLHWEKLPLILQHIKEYDYVVWIDADAYFYTDAAPLEDLITSSKKDIILSGDRENICPPHINSGFFILKNTKKVIEILTKWAFSDELRHKYLNLTADAQLDGQGRWCGPDDWVEDQAVIRGYVKDNIDNINEITKVFDYPILQHFHERELATLNRYNIYPYVHHLAGICDKPEYRLEIAEKYLANLDCRQ
jgi:hypothetical protein